jgi:N-acetylglucosaminyldiphosphoundecaprenol N-acetyl-beta-D-mannosaminyltransferase
MYEQVTILGVKINQLSFDRVFAIIKKWCQENEQHKIFTINPEFLVVAKDNLEFKRVLNSADINTCDGIGLSLASDFLYKKSLERVTGSDLSRRLLDDPAGLKIFLLGGDEGVAKAVRTKFVFSNIVGAESGGYLINKFGSWTLENNREIIDRINASGANLLLVAFGQVKQELWINNNLILMPGIKVAIGVGGTFDFLADRIKRAPTWMRKFGLEWLYRLIKEPKRFRRIWNATVTFGLMIIKEKLK